LFRERTYGTSGRGVEGFYKTHGVKMIDEVREARDLLVMESRKLKKTMFVRKKTFESRERINGKHLLCS